MAESDQMTLKVGIESDQMTLKVGIHSFPAWRSAFKRVSVKIGRQARLLCPWARHLTGLPLPVSGWTDNNKVAAWFEDRKGHFAVSWSKYLDK